MDDTFGKFVGLILGIIAFAFLLYAAIILALFAATVGVGVWGLVSVKLKRPLVNPNGPIAVPLIYSFLWASVITLALFAGSMAINEYMPRRPQNPFLWLRNDALLFLVETLIVLFVSARSSKSNLAMSNLSFASSMVCFSASMIFTIGSSIDLNLMLAQIPRSLVQELWNTLTFPLLVLDALKEGVISAAQGVYTWVLATNGNLFKISSVLSKILWVASIFYAAKGWLRPKRSPEAIRRKALTSGERKNLAQALILGFAMFLILGWITIEILHETHYGVAWSQVSPVVAVLSLIGVHLGLLYTLYCSREGLAP